MSARILISNLYNEPIKIIKVPIIRCNLPGPFENMSNAPEIAREAAVFVNCNDTHVWIKTTNKKTWETMVNSLDVFMLFKEAEIMENEKMLKITMTTVYHSILGM